MKVFCRLFSSILTSSIGLLNIQCRLVHVNYYINHACIISEPHTATKLFCTKQVHFEASQLESRRRDGIRKPKPTAIPTLFKVPTPPPQVTSMTMQTRFSSFSKPQMYSITMTAGPRWMPSQSGLILKMISIIALNHKLMEDGFACCADALAKMLLKACFQ